MWRRFGIEQKILAQFREPTGWLGSLVGRLMVRLNRPLNEWAVSLLEIGRTDRFLEVGFDPELAIERAAEIALDGFIAGLECSKAMIRQARKRNAATIQVGRVHLVHGNASALPYRDQSFNKVLAVNSLPFWSEPTRCLKQLARVLKPKGRIVIGLQPRRVTTEQVQEIGQDVLAQFASAGFLDLRLEVRELKSAPALCVVGFK